MSIVPFYLSKTKKYHRDARGSTGQRSGSWVEPFLSSQHCCIGQGAGEKKIPKDWTPPFFWSKAYIYIYRVTLPQRLTFIWFYVFSIGIHVVMYINIIYIIVIYSTLLEPTISPFYRNFWVVFELMIFRLSHGGICDCSLEGMYNIYTLYA